jgi:pseudouridine kinase
MSAYIAVCGAVNIDVGGRSLAPLVPGDSNPGVICSSLGGVGRNIAHNLALLGAEVKLITALGGDDGARRVRGSCRALGIDLGYSLTVPEGVTSSYLSIAGPDGDMALALSDMSIYERLTPDWLAAVLPVLNAAALVVLDANLPAESIEFIAENCTAPIFADPVSAAKAPRLHRALHRLHTLKPNRLEAEALCGLPITDKESALRAADALLATGLRRVFLSLGPHGVLAVEGIEQLFLPNPPLRKRENASGCGDAFMAALAWAFLQGADLRRSALCGLTAAAVTMERAETVNPGMSAGLIQSRMELI